MKTYILLFVSMLALSCDKDVTQSQLTLDATVLSLSASDCKLPLLDFGTSADQIGQLTATGKEAKVFYAVHLEKRFIVGDRLSVIIRAPTQNESPACTMMGTTYPAITVVGAIMK